MDIAVHRYTLTSAFGQGLAANRAGLTGGRSALSSYALADGFPCALGRVSGLEDVVIAERLARYDCRNNRLAELALETDGFKDAVA
ncbi:MAG: beta-ketoacyl-[acyl-carrier-protein] synthase II, partial [Acidiferrobacter sp.]